MRKWLTIQNVVELSNLKRATIEDLIDNDLLPVEHRRRRRMVATECLIRFLQLDDRAEWYEQGIEMLSDCVISPS